MQLKIRTKHGTVIHEVPSNWLDHQVTKEKKTKTIERTIPVPTVSSYKWKQWTNAHNEELQKQTNKTKNAQYHSREEHEYSWLKLSHISQSLSSLYGSFIEKCHFSVIRLHSIYQLRCRHLQHADDAFCSLNFQPHLYFANFSHSLISLSMLSSVALAVGELACTAL